MFLDDHVTWAPPLGPQGIVPVKLILENGVLDLTAITSLNNAFAVDLVDALGGCPGNLFSFR